MTQLATSLARAVVDHELPGHDYTTGSTDPVMTNASHMAGLLDDWMVGDLELETTDFIKLMRKHSDFDLGDWLERHRDRIDF